MKKKLLFIAVMLIAILSIATMASAASIDNVAFMKGTDEVFIVGAGNISATVDITVEEATEVALITAAYDGNRLTSIQYEGKTITPEQKTYQGSPVTVTAATTNVEVMVWGLEDHAPIDTKESLTNVSRQIRITDVSVTEAPRDDGKASLTFTGYVDNELGKIYVEQIVDYMGPKKAAEGGKDSSYYDERVDGDYKALSNTFSYKVNGEAKTATLALDATTPQKLTVTALNGRERTYDVILEKHVAFTTYNFNNLSSFELVSDGVNGNGQAIKPAYKLIALNSAMYNGRSRWKEAAFYVLNNNTNSIETYQDTTKDAYYSISYVRNEADKVDKDGAVKVVTKRKSGDGLNPYIQVQDYNNDVHKLLRQDKYDYSFDFRYADYTGSDALFTGGIAGDWAIASYIARVGIAKADGAAEDCLGLTYKRNDVAAAVKIADIAKDTWYNIRIIADKDATDGKIKIVLDGEVIYKTDVTTTAGLDTTSGAGKNTFRGHASSTANGTFYLDNIIRTYSQAKPAA